MGLSLYGILRCFQDFLTRFRSLQESMHDNDVGPVGALFYQGILSTCRSCSALYHGKNRPDVPVHSSQNALTAGRVSIRICSHLQYHWCAFHHLHDHDLYGMSTTSTLHRAPRRISDDEIRPIYQLLDVGGLKKNSNKNYFRAIIFEMRAQKLY